MLAENFKVLQNKLKTDKPLKYSVLTHHHQRQLKLLEPALSLGSKIITVESNLVAISKELDRQIESNNFMIVKDKLSLFGGSLIIYDIPTAHADHNLVVYIEKEELLFAEDHFEILYQNGELRPFKNMALFAKKIKNLKRPISTLVNGASQQPLSMKDFEQAVSNYKEPTCPKELNVCKND